MNKTVQPNNSNCDGPTGPTGPAPTLAPLNYSQNSTGSVLILASDSRPATIISTTITTTGNPVQVIVSGDCENSVADSYCKVKLYRDSTEIGNDVQLESTAAASQNNGYCLQVIDTPSSGTYTYSLKLTTLGGGGNFKFGEASGPIISAVELANIVGPTGNTGPTGPIGNTGPTGPPGLTKYTQFANAGISVILNNIKVRIPSSGNRSLQIATVSGSYNVSGSHSYINSGVTRSNNLRSLSVNTTFVYLNSSNNLAVNGDVSVWNIMDTSQQKCWRITCIIGASYNNNCITIEELI